MDGTASFGSLDIATAATPWFPLALLLLIGVGYAGMLVTSSANTQLQLSAPDDLRGRVMSVYSLMFTGVTPIGALVTGFLADAIHVRLTLGIEAAICVVVASAAMLVLRSRTAELVYQPSVAG